MEQISFPNDPFFNKLLDAAKTSEKTVIRDNNSGIQAKFPRLLSDVSDLRTRLTEGLPAALIDENGLINEDNVYISVYAISGYHFIVALLAVSSLGGVFLPLPIHESPESCINLIKVSNSHLMLVEPNYENDAALLQESVKNTCDRAIKQLMIWREGISPGHTSYSVHKTAILPASRNAVVLFSSGTQGTPKAIVHTRALLYELAARDYVNRDDTYISFSELRHFAPLLSVFMMLLAGSSMEILDCGPRPDKLWERLRRGDVTIFTAGSVVWTEMMRFYQQHLAILPDDTSQQYIRGIRNVRFAGCGGGVIPPFVKQFWLDTLSVPMMNSYGSTELGMTSFATIISNQESCQVSWVLFVCISTGANIEDLSKQKAIIGQKIPPYISIKLSEGDHGEVLMKGPAMFSCYLANEVATRNAFDEDGYFKTGDIAHMEETRYIFDGRASTEFIRSSENIVRIQDVESSLLELPNISEAAVVKCPDAEAGSQVAAIIRLLDSKNKYTLQQLRQDLSSSLSRYQLPTQLRILGPTENIPRSSTGKLKIQEALKMYFPLPGADQRVENRVP
ncbi:hypothetical protein FQN57_001515 [Myotisia sp. PD_48]|nr:hypothetical protein FQN57_001515 [Myotisia sp. PD_48]